MDKVTIGHYPLIRLPSFTNFFQKFKSMDEFYEAVETNRDLRFADNNGKLEYFMRGRLDEPIDSFYIVEYENLCNDDLYLSIVPRIIYDTWGGHVAAIKEILRTAIGEDAPALYTDTTEGLTCRYLRLEGELTKEYMIAGNLYMIPDIECPLTVSHDWMHENRIVRYTNKRFPDNKILIISDIPNVPPHWEKVYDHF